MKVSSLLTCLSFFVVISFSASAQKSSMVKADASYTKGDYYDAISNYQSAFQQEKSKEMKARALFMIAECYRITNDYKNQVVWYGKAVSNGYKDPIAKLRYAEALRMNGKYDEAIVQYNNYKKDVPGSAEADIGIKSSEDAQKWKDKPTRWKVENQSALNTKYGDFAVCYSSKNKNSLIFASSRQESIGSDDEGTGEKFSDLYESTIDKKGKWSSPVALPKPLNSEANEGAATMDKKAADMYFTRCGFGKNQISSCGIFFTKKQGQLWSEPKEIPMPCDTCSYGHPALSPDEQTLYFASNMDGGFGGRDIWMSSYSKSKHEWGPPVNLGNKINTAEDDMFPSMSIDSTLYFSSRGHSGMGGLDIYKAKRTASGFTTPENLKAPINSPADDFGLIMDDSGIKGYMCSNRADGKGGDDIYSVELPPLIFDIEGSVTNVTTGAAVKDANLLLVGSDGSSVPFVTQDNGTYRFDLKPETSYKISATLDKYLNKYVEVSTVGLLESKHFRADFTLQEMTPVIVLPGILYEVSKWDLKPESQTELDGLVKTLEDNPTLVIEIGSHTDSRPIPMTNDTLSFHRADTVVSYLIMHGIDRERLVAKGYAARVPRVIDAEYIKKQNLPSAFKAGDAMTEAYIKKLKSKDQMEMAHQANRRTEFKILSHAYKKGESLDLTQPQDTSLNASQNNKVIETEAKKVEVVENKKVEEPKTMQPGKTYIVEEKDSYGSVAKKFGMKQNELKELNGIKSQDIRPGMELKVEKDGDYTDFDKKFYVLQKDDSYSKIAKKLSLKVADLKKLNKGIEQDDFKPGMKIRIAQ